MLVGIGKEQRNDARLEFRIQREVFWKEMQGEGEEGPRVAKELIERSSEI